MCRQKFLIQQMIPIKKMGPSLIPFLREAVSGYDSDGMICQTDYRKLRMSQVQMLFEQGDSSSINLENILIGDELSAHSINQEFQNQLTIGEKFAQKATPFIGSWGFVLLLLGLVIFWISYNTQRELSEHFDPFPFVLLNLFLSCMAAVQAPIIMMSQNRIAKREKLRADEDYYTTLKAELGIRKLHAKLDEFLKTQDKKN